MYHFFQQIVINLAAWKTITGMIWCCIVIICFDLKVILMLNCRCSISSEKFFSVRFKRQLLEMQVLDWLLDLLIFIRVLTISQVAFAYSNCLLNNLIEIYVWYFLINMICELRMNVSPHDILVRKRKFLKNLSNHGKLRMKELRVFLHSVNAPWTLLLTKSINDKHLSIRTFAQTLAIIQWWNALTILC